MLWILSPSFPSDLASIHFSTFTCILLSFVEALHAFLGITSTKFTNALLFVAGRAFIALFIARYPENASSFAFILTATFWSFGELVRFSSFALSSLLSSQSARFMRVRYTLGPIMFALGFLGEWRMLFSASSLDRPVLLAVALVFPLAWFPLFRGLLKQRAKFYSHLKFV